MESGPEIELDHYMVYAARTSYAYHTLRLNTYFLLADYELGRLFACMGKTDEARKHFDLVLSGVSQLFRLLVLYIMINSDVTTGKPLEVNTSARKVSIRS